LNYIVRKFIINANILIIVSIAEPAGVKGDTGSCG